MEERQTLRRATKLRQEAYRYQMEGELDRAIELSIGVYLMQRQFPFMNLGRIYLRHGRWWEALREFEGAVRLAPGDVRAAEMLHRLRARLN